MKIPTIRAWADVQFAIDLIVKALGGRSIRSGNVTLAWAASTSSGNQVVTHGLPAGTTPTGVQLTPRSVPFAAGVVIMAKCVARDATTITINAETNVAVTGSVIVDWLAVG